MDKKAKIAIGAGVGVVVVAAAAVAGVGFMQSSSIASNLEKMVAQNKDKLPEGVTHKINVKKGIFQTTAKYIVNVPKGDEDIKAGDIITDISVKHSPSQILSKNYVLKAITQNHLFKNAKTSSSYFALTEIDLSSNSKDLKGKTTFSPITFRETQTSGQSMEVKIEEYIAEYVLKEKGDVSFKFNLPKIQSTEKMGNIGKITTITGTSADFAYNLKNPLIYKAKVSVKEIGDKNSNMKNFVIDSSFTAEKDKYHFVNQFSVGELNAPMVKNVSGKFAFSVKDLDKSIIDKFDKKKIDDKEAAKDYIKENFVALMKKGFSLSIDNAEFKSESESFNNNVSAQFLPTETPSFEDFTKLVIGLKATGQFEQLISMFSSNFANEPGYQNNNGEFFFVYQDKNITLNNQPFTNELMTLSLRKALRNIDEKLGFDVSAKAPLIPQMESEGAEVSPDDQANPEAQMPQTQQDFKKMKFKDNVTYVPKSIALSM